MKKISKLNQDLKKLQSQKKDLISIETISLFQFLKFKNLISKENKINKQIEKLSSQAEEINFWYDSNTKSWIQNPKINCRKYDRLHKRAKYKRDLKLYQLGYLDYLPLPPILQKFKQFLPKIDYSKLNFFKNISNEFNYFKSYKFPQKINQLAINTTKKFIQGYRKIQSDYKFIRTVVGSKSSIRYIKSIIEQATIQIDEKDKISIQNSPKPRKKEFDFRQSLKVNPINPLTSLQTKGKMPLRNKSNSMQNTQHFIPRIIEL